MNVYQLQCDKKTINVYLNPAKIVVCKNILNFKT